MTQQNQSKSRSRNPHLEILVDQSPVHPPGQLQLLLLARVLPPDLRIVHFHQFVCSRKRLGEERGAQLLVCHRVLEGGQLHDEIEVRRSELLSVLLATALDGAERGLVQPISARQTHLQIFEPLHKPYCNPTSNKVTVSILIRNLKPDYRTRCWPGMIAF
jgi:hypothetical protein